jgi:hypothetical protein
VANGDISRLSPRGTSVNDRFWCMTAFGAALGLSSQALFLEVIPEKADQRCLTSWLPSTFRYHCVSEPCTGSCPYQ